MKINTSSDLLILISEKGGKQARDNGFAYFKHRMTKGFKNTYYVHTKDNLDLEKLTLYPKNIVLKNSRKHKSLFYKADYLVLNDGYMDVFPSFKTKPLSQWLVIYSLLTTWNYNLQESSFL